MIDEAYLNRLTLLTKIKPLVGSSGYGVRTQLSFHRACAVFIAIMTFCENIYTSHFAGLFPTSDYAMATWLQVYNPTWSFHLLPPNGQVASPAHIRYQWNVLVLTQESVLNFLSIDNSHPHTTTHRNTHFLA